MSFLNPLGWWLAFVAIPIVVLYILKVRLREVTVSSSIFWEQVFEERRSRSFWRQLRHLLSLLLSLIFLALLVGAVLNPILVSQKSQGKVVIVFDNSASMNAKEEGASRFEEAKTILHRLVAESGARRETAIITAGGTPKVVLGLTDHFGTLRKAVEAIPRTDLPTSLNQAVELARFLVSDSSEDNGTQNNRGESGSRIYVITDGCVASPEKNLSAADITFFPVGKPLGNLAITRFQPRRSLADPIGYEVLIEIANKSDEHRECRLQLEFSEEIVDLISLSLEPNAVETRIARGATDRGGILKATLEIEDALPTDNTAWAVLPAKPVQKILLAGENDFFLEQVLRSQQNVEIIRTTGDGEPETGEGTSVIPKTIPPDTVLILHQHIPEVIPSGNVLIIDPRNGCDLFELGEPIESPLIGQTDKDSPLMRFVHLNNVLLPGARKIIPRESEGRPHVLAETPEGEPVYVQWEEKGSREHRDETPESPKNEASLGDPDLQPGKTLVLSAELKRGDLALRTAFPILVSHALGYFRGEGGELEKAYKTGEPVVLPVDTNETSVRLQAPDGSERTFPVESGTVALGGLPSCGIWELIARETRRPIACNIADAGESDLRTAPNSLDAARPEVNRQSAALPPIWFVLTVLALVLTLFDWFLYQRRWID